MKQIYTILAYDNINIIIYYLSPKSKKKNEYLIKYLSKSRYYYKYIIHPFTFR